jgi:hypothetical protein
MGHSTPPWSASTRHPQHLKYSSMLPQPGQGASWYRMISSMSGDCRTRLQGTKRNTMGVCRRYMQNGMVSAMPGDCSTRLQRTEEETKGTDV